MLLLWNQWPDFYVTSFDASVLIPFKQKTTRFENNSKIVEFDKTSQKCSLGIYQHSMVTRDYVYRTRMYANSAEDSIWYIIVYDFQNACVIICKYMYNVWLVIHHCAQGESVRP
jgi:hypothetical protein